MTSELYEPQPEDRFTFGLWTVGNVGRDPFGVEVRNALDPVDIVHHLADIGAYGVTLHDNDLVPVDASASEREVLLKRFRAALDSTGLKVPMTTVNLFTRPVFREGALTATDPEVRRFALRKATEAIDIAAELGATIFVLWGGREGTEAHAAKPRRRTGPLRRGDRRSMTAIHRPPGLRGADRDRAQAQRAARDTLPADHRTRVGLHRDDSTTPERVGVNPEIAHETMSGLSFHHGVGQALWAGKLFHIDLNAQRIGRFDQDFRFGSEEIKEAFSPGPPVGDLGLRRPAPLRRPPLPNRGPDDV